MSLLSTAARRLRLAAAFLTRLPVRAPEAAPEEVGRSLVWFPVVGLGLGLGLVVLARLLGGALRFDLVAALLIAALAAVTGALHLDGLADVFDGLGGGHGDRERTLAIMRDGPIGAHGATALVLVLAVKILALGAVLQAGDLRAVALFPVVGRWLAPLLIALFPYVRPEGVGRAFADHVGASEIVFATLVTSAALTAGGFALLGAAIPAALIAIGLGVWLTRRLGGLTGDVYGAAIEIGEAAFLVAVAARF